MKKEQIDLILISGRPGKFIQRVIANKIRFMACNFH